MINFAKKNSAFWTKAAMLSGCLYISAHFLRAQHLQSNSEAFYSQVATTTMRQLPMTKKQTWQGWSFCVESGIAFRTTKQIKWKNAPKYRHGLLGVLDGLGAVGGKYGRVFQNDWYAGVTIMWQLFFPDVRWHIPNPQWPFWLPVMYFDVGYVTEKNVVFSLGSFYFWGIAPSMAVPVTDNLSVKVRPVLMLDRPLLGRGVHNFLFNVGLSYRL